MHIAGIYILAPHFGTFLTCCTIKQTPHTHTSTSSKIKLPIPMTIQTTAPVVRPVELPNGGKLVVEVLVSLWVDIVPRGSVPAVNGLVVGSWVVVALGDPAVALAGGSTVVPSTAVVTMGTVAAVVGD